MKIIETKLVSELTQREQSKQNALYKVYDMKHVKSVSAHVLLRDGKYAGKIVANWSDNPAGTCCHVLVDLDGYSGTAKAGGYGYDKLSNAVYHAMRDMRKLTFDGPDRQETLTIADFTVDFENIRSDWQNAFRKAGYDVIYVC